MTQRTRVSPTIQSLKFQQLKRKLFPDADWDDVEHEIPNPKKKQTQSLSNKNQNIENSDRPIINDDSLLIDPNFLDTSDGKRLAGWYKLRSELPAGRKKLFDLDEIQNQKNEHHISIKWLNKADVAANPAESQHERSVDEPGPSAVATSDPVNESNSVQQSSNSSLLRKAVEKIRSFKKATFKSPGKSGTLRKSPRKSPRKYPKSPFQRPSGSVQGGKSPTRNTLTRKSLLNQLNRKQLEQKFDEVASTPFDGKRAALNSSVSPIIINNGQVEGIIRLTVREPEQINELVPVEARKTQHTRNTVQVLEQIVIPPKINHRISSVEQSPIGVIPVSARPKNLSDVINAQVSEAMLTKRNENFDSSPESDILTSIEEQPELESQMAVNIGSEVEIQSNPVDGDEGLQQHEISQEIIPETQPDRPGTAHSNASVRYSQRYLADSSSDASSVGSEILENFCESILPNNLAAISPLAPPLVQSILQSNNTNSTRQSTNSSLFTRPKSGRVQKKKKKTIPNAAIQSYLELNRSDSDANPLHRTVLKRSTNNKSKRTLYSQRFDDSPQRVTFSNIRPSEHIPETQPETDKTQPKKTRTTIVEDIEIENQSTSPEKPRRTTRSSLKQLQNVHKQQNTGKRTSTRQAPVKKVVPAKKNTPQEESETSEINKDTSGLSSKENVQPQPNKNAQPRKPRNNIRKKNGTENKQDQLVNTRTRVSTYIQPDSGTQKSNKGSVNTVNVFVDSDESVEVERPKAKATRQGRSKKVVPSSVTTLESAANVNGTRQNNKATTNIVDVSEDPDERPKAIATRQGRAKKQDQPKAKATRQGTSRKVLSSPESLVESVALVNGIRKSARTKYLPSNGRNTKIVATAEVLGEIYKKCAPPHIPVLPKHLTTTFKSRNHHPGGKNEPQKDTTQKSGKPKQNNTVKKVAKKPKTGRKKNQDKENEVQTDAAPTEFVAIPSVQSISTIQLPEEEPQQSVANSRSTQQNLKRNKEAERSDANEGSGEPSSVRNNNFQQTSDVFKIPNPSTKQKRIRNDSRKKKNFTAVNAPHESLDSGLHSEASNVSTIGVRQIQQQPPTTIQDCIIGEEPTNSSQRSQRSSHSSSNDSARFNWLTKLLDESIRDPCRSPPPFYEHDFDELALSEEIHFIEHEGVAYASYISENFKNSGYMRFNPKVTKTRSKAKHYDLRFLVLKGDNIEVCVNNKQLKVNEGSMFFVKKGTSYTIANKSNSKVLLFYNRYS